MVSGPRQPSDEPAELLVEAGDMDTGSETELLSGSDAISSSRVSCRQACRAGGRSRLRLRLGAAAGFLALACTLVMTNRIAAGPALSTTRMAGSIGLDSQSSSSSSSSGSSDDQASCNCAVDEEYFGGLCYKQCKILTKGAYTIRTSAMTCCKSKPCFLNQKHDMGLCSGFSVAGGNSSSCPHPPGCCLPNEEMLLGQCYKKCSLLTQNKFSYRVSPTTCCNRDSEFLCFLPKTGYSATDTKFGVGGGNDTAAHLLLTSVNGQAAAAAVGATKPPSGQVTTVAPAGAAVAASTTAQNVQAAITQPELPDWYKDMQAQSAGQSTQSPGQSTQSPARATQAPQAATSSAAPTQPPKSEPTPPPVPDWALDTSTYETVTPAPAPAPSPAPAAVAPSPAPEPAPAPAPAAPAPAPPAPLPVPQEQPTTPPAQGTTMPSWLQEIVAQPADANTAATTARPAPTVAPAAPAAPAAIAAPTYVPATAVTSASQATQMPDWASEMLNDQETPSRKIEAPSSASSSPATQSAAQGAPPVPDWAKDYIAASQ